jgi:predicted ATPase/class 3 adenylate cyclase
VTFLFTDIEGSTRLFHRLGASYDGVLEAHRQLIRAAVAGHGGFEVNSEGDGFLFAFADAAGAVEACVDAQRALAIHPWPLDAEVRVRMGLHTGVATPTGEGDYVALAVHQAARVAGAAHGGQVLLSAQTAGLVKTVLAPDMAVADRGSFLLKDFDEPQQLYQVTHPDLEAGFPPVRASPAVQHNLPDLRTNFIGRDRDLEVISALLGEARLVSVVGSGGSGKTRVAIEVSARLAPGYPAGVQLADLSGLREPSLVPTTIAAAFGLQPVPGLDSVEAVGRFVGERPALLVLDNCEHLLDAAAETVEALLDCARGLSVLATSREPLGLSGERLWRIGPLAAPAVGADVAEVSDCEAVRLFVDRARLVSPDFEVTAANAAAVADICRGVEGIPLAVEIVAAMAATLPMEAMAARVGDRHWLRHGRRRGMDRQRTLEATIDWSYQLLDDQQRRLLQSLSVFVTPFTLEAVVAVSDLDDPVDSLSRLVNRSLVVYDAAAGRYRLLETVRSFSRERLDEAGQTEPASDRHLAFYADWAVSMFPVTFSSREIEIFDLADQQLGDLRAALAWAVQQGNANGHRLMSGLFTYWVARRGAEGLSWSEQLIGLVADREPELEIQICAVSAGCAFTLGNMKLALERSQRAVTLVEESHDYITLGLAFGVRGNALVIPDPVEAEQFLIKGRDVLAAVGRLEFAVNAWQILALAAEFAGDLQAALAHSREGLAVCAGKDVSTSAYALLLLRAAFYMHRTGSSTEDVLPVLKEAVEQVARTRSPILVAVALDYSAEIMAASQPPAAAQLLQASDSVKQRYGVTSKTTADMQQVRASIMARIDEHAAQPFREPAVDMSVDDAIEIARTAVT